MPMEPCDTAITTRRMLMRDKLIKSSRVIRQVASQFCTGALHDGQVLHVAIQRMLVDVHIAIN
jgi:hypothetical protein